jgi:AP-1 complex subunit gamma-1
MVIYNSRAALLERMPVLDEATYYSAKQVEVGVDANQTAKSGPHSNGHAKQPNGVAKHLAPETALIDLLSFLPDEQPSAPDKSPDDSLLGSLGINTLAGSDIMTSPGEYFLLSYGRAGAVTHI